VPATSNQTRILAPVAVAIAGERTAATPIEEWRRFWPLVLTAAVGFSIMSFMTAVAGVFKDPLAQEFGWNRTQLSAGIALSSLLAILLSPFIGVLIDRLGTRRLAIPGIALTSAAVAAFSLASGSVTLWIALWAVWGLCSLLVQSTVWSTAVAGVFHAGRGLALGVTMAGTALAQIIAPPLTNWLIGEFGWRAAYVWLGCGWGAVAFILSLFFLFDAHSLRSRQAFATGRERDTKSELPGLSIAQAWRNSALWRVATSTFLIMTITVAVVVHQFPILVEAGVTRAQAAWLVSLSGVAGIVGKLVTGTLIDRFHARWVGGITLASTAIAYPLLVEPLRTPLLIVIGIMISGYAAGTKMQLCSYLTARYAGMRHYGTIFGFMTSVIALASAIGPLVAGLSRDRFDSYAPILLIGVVISLLSGLLVFSLGRYPDWTSDRAAD
jgi:predicted MFS family arabinose efflux permease